MIWYGYIVRVVVVTVVVVVIVVVAAVAVIAAVVVVITEIMKQRLQSPLLSCWHVCFLTFVTTYYSYINSKIQWSNH